MTQQREPINARTWIALGVIAFVATGLRFWSLDTIPPGLWFDEALNAQDARAAIGDGGLQLVYPDEFPREPMFVTLLAGAMALGADSVPALRAVSGVVGILTVVALFFCVRLYADDRLALLSAATLATMRWHLIFSRLLFRTILAPFWIVLVVWLAGEARRSPRGWKAALLGAVVGGGFYTYLSWYFMLPGIAGLLVLTFFEARRDRTARVRAVICLISAIVVVAPLGIHYSRAPEHLFSRAEAVSPFQEGGGEALKEISKNFFQTLGMLHWRGDHVPKHNIPLAPAIDRLSGLFFLVGLGAVLAGLRRREPLGAILLVWLMLGLAPTIFSRTDSPNFLRTLVAAPAVAAITARGLSTIWSGLTRTAWAPPRLAPIVVVAFLGLIGALTVRDVYWRWGRSAETWGSFNPLESQLGVAAAGAPKGASFWVPEYMGSHRSFKFLAAEAPQVRLYNDFRFLRPDPEIEGPRLVVATMHNQLLGVLERLVPSGRVAREFLMPDEEVWARLYEIPPGGLPSAEEVARAESRHRVDIRW